LSRYQFQRSLQAAFAAPVLTASPSLAVAAADVEVDPEPIMGKPGDAASWRTTEFNSDWGLQAINADVAYARAGPAPASAWACSTAAPAWTTTSSPARTTAASIWPTCWPMAACARAKC
jgi:hypothetical protein